MKNHHPMQTIDVAHPPMRPDEVELLLLQSVSNTRNTPGIELLKIVHGYGSSGRGGSTRDVVRNWLYRHPNLYLAVIPGEEYTLFHDAVQELRKSLGPFADPDLSASNPGITVVWVKK